MLGAFSPVWERGALGGWCSLLPNWHLTCRPSIWLRRYLFYGLTSVVVRWWMRYSALPTLRQALVPQV